MGLKKRAIPRMRWLAVLVFGATLLLTTAAASTQPARGAAVAPKADPAAAWCCRRLAVPPWGSMTSPRSRMPRAGSAAQPTPVSTVPPTAR